MTPRVRFWLHGPILPMLLVQGRWVRWRLPTLPEAEGPREGIVGEELGDPLSIAVLGESTAAGVGVSRQDEALAFALARTLAREKKRAVHVQVAGRNGATLKRTRAELMPQLRLPCDTVIVITGVNDTAELTRGRAWSNEVRAVVSELSARGARQVIFSGIPPLGVIPAFPQPMRSAIGARATYLDRILRDTCTDVGAHHVPVSFPPRPELLSSDHFHPSAEGYTAWAEALVASWPAEDSRHGGADAASRTSNTTTPPNF